MGFFNVFVTRDVSRGHSGMTLDEWWDAQTYSNLKKWCDKQKYDMDDLTVKQKSHIRYLNEK